LLYRWLQELGAPVVEREGRQLGGGHRGEAACERGDEEANRRSQLGVLRGARGVHRRRWLFRQVGRQRGVAVSRNRGPLEDRKRGEVASQRRGNAQVRRRDSAPPRGVVFLGRILQCGRQ